MATESIVAKFTDKGSPATGLSATIRIRRIDTGALVVTDSAMTELGDGAYKYSFTSYDESLEYVYRCDGGATLSDYERYVFGTNEVRWNSDRIEDNIRGVDDDDLKVLGDLLDALPDVAAITSGVWSESLPGAYGAGEAGYIVGSLLDAAVSSRSSHSAADVDSILSGSHGSGSWEGDSAATIDALLSTNHGSGNWEGDSAAAIDALLTANHGSGSWQTGLTSVDYDLIADKVWDELASEHTDSGSMGEILNLLNSWIDLSHAGPFDPLGGYP